MRRGTEARQQQRRRLLAYAVLAVLSLVLSACGSHVVVAEQTDASVPVTDADAQSVQDDADQGVFTCGRKRCTNHPTVIAGLTLNGYACCYDARRSACGAIELDNCIELDQPGRPESSCPMVTYPPLGVLPGCCTPDGTCGSLETNVGVGCVQIPVLTPFGVCKY
jgi:hypothetical protein